MLDGRIWILLSSEKQYSRAFVIILSIISNQIRTLQILPASIPFSTLARKSLYDINHTGVNNAGNTTAIFASGERDAELPAAATAAVAAIAAVGR